MANLATRDGARPPAVNRPAQEIWIDQYLDEKQSEFLRYLQIVTKRKWLVLAVAAAVFAAGAAVTLRSARVFTSSVNIQIDPEQQVLPYKESVNAVVPDSTYLGTQAQVLKSEALAGRVVTKLELASDPEKVNSLARWIAGSIEVAPVQGTQIVKVTFRAEDPEFAARAVNTVADEYVTYGLESKRRAIENARDFLQGELTKLQQNLQRSEQKLVDYGQQHNILQTPENNNITRKLAELNEEMTKVESQVLANQYQELQSTPIESFPETLKTTVMRDLDSRRSDLEQKLATATLKFESKWPEVLTLNQQLADIRSQLAAEKRKSLNRRRPNINWRPHTSSGSRPPSRPRPTSPTSCSRTRFSTTC